MTRFHQCEMQWSGCEEGAISHCPTATVEDKLRRAHVSQSDWEAYALALYDAPPNSLPQLPTIADVEMVYTGLLPLVNVDTRECHIGVDAAYRQPQPHPPYAAYYRRTKPVRAIESHSWVEVTHCSHVFEAGAAWFYVLPGSAVYVNVGNTIAFPDHDDAAAHFLPAYMATADYRRAHRERDIVDIPRAAEAQGYDTIQYLKHCDLSCGRCAHELNFVSAQGLTGCPAGIEFRTGWNASKRCACTTLRGGTREGVAQQCAACESFPMEILTGS